MDTEIEIVEEGELIHCPFCGGEHKICAEKISAKSTFSASAMYYYCNKEDGIFLGALGNELLEGLHKVKHNA